MIDEDSGYVHGGEQAKSHVVIEAFDVKAKKRVRLHGEVIVPSEYAKGDSVFGLQIEGIHIMRPRIVGDDGES